MWGFASNQIKPNASGAERALHVTIQSRDGVLVRRDDGRVVGPRVGESNNNVKEVLQL
jgi:hypothetical protein